MVIGANTLKCSREKVDISQECAHIYLLYTLPMNINVYVSFLINKLDAIVRGWKYTK